MWWLIGIAVLIALLVSVAWRQRGRAGERFMTQRDVDGKSSKGSHGGFTGIGPTPG
jgi:hypothetical protein